MRCHYKKLVHFVGGCLSYFARVFNLRKLVCGSFQNPYTIPTNYLRSFRQLLVSCRINCRCLKKKFKKIHHNIETFIKIWVLLTSALGALFKHATLSNYSLKISKFSIYNTLITQAFIKKLLFKVLNQYSRVLVNISLKI